MSLTTLDLDNEALEAAMRLSGLKTKKDVVNMALREYAGRHRRIAALERYAALGADWDYDHWAREHSAEKAGDGRRTAGSGRDRLDSQS